MDATGRIEKLSVLMPVHNEARTIREIVHRVLAAPIEPAVELTIVNDGSTDGSRDIIDDLASGDERINAVHHERSLGKGSAIRTAIGAMTGDVAIVQDADLEYDPRDFAVVLDPILAGEADAVYGSRFLKSPRRQVHGFWHSQGNRVLTLVCNMASNLALSDMETCYKAVRADLLKEMPLTSTRFEFEVEVTMRLARRGARIYEVPISYHGRTREEGKQIGVRDGFHALWAILKYGVLDRR
ncbi:MAG: glycosyltransferase family 2 protein [Planctomycetota bacterium]